MAYYNFKMVRDRLSEWRVKDWEESGGSADYDSELWRHAAEYIDELKLQVEECDNYLFSKNQAAEIGCLPRLVSLKATTEENKI